MRNLIISITLLLQSSLLLSQTITWQTDVEQDSPTEAYLLLKANISNGVELLKDNLNITYLNPEDSFTPIGNLQKPKAESGVYTGDVTFKQLVILNEPEADITIKGQLAYTWKKNAKTYQQSAPLEFNIKADAETAGTASNHTIQDTTTLTEEGHKRPSFSVDQGVVSQNTNENDQPNKGLLAFMLLAFGSGLAALLTPCVFPLIPLTVSFFTVNKSNSKQGRGFSKALLYGLFIILIYVVAGSIVARVNGPEFANWLSTHWLPNVLFFVIFLVFAMSFLGMFELTLPNSWINKMDQMSNKGGVLGIFFMAFTLVLVSFSCTGPIVGSVLVLSAGGAVIKPVAGMFAFSLALAMPFTFFATFPKWLQKIPKSGGWLQEVKVVLGFLELAFALKFLSVADQVYHWGILDRDVYLALWIVIFALLGFYLLGKIRPPHHSEQKTTSVPKLLMAIIVFSFVVYLIPGMVGAPLRPLSGYLPPLTTQEFIMDINLIPAGVVNSSLYGEKQNALLKNYENEMFSKGKKQAVSGSVCGPPKYADMLHLPHGLDGYFDLEQAKACAKAQDKPIFIDFTGHGCVNCRAMEARVWSDTRVLNILKNHYVVVALYVDEKTELPEEEWYVSEYDGKTKKTIGKQNADFQIVKYNNNAQPLYVLMSPDGENLVPPKAYDLDVKNFITFLENGLDQYGQLK